MNYFQKVKSFFEENKSDFYVATLIFLVSLMSFGLGRLSILWPKKEPIRIDQAGGVDQSAAIGVLGENDNNFTKRSDSSTSPVSSVQGKFIASKSGRAYHFPWCAGALKIKEENKIWFQTKEEAETAGYKPAGNCEGL